MGGISCDSTFLLPNKPRIGVLVYYSHALLTQASAQLIFPFPVSGLREGFREPGLVASEVSGLSGRMGGPPVRLSILPARGGLAGPVWRHWLSSWHVNHMKSPRWSYRAAFGGAAHALHSSLGLRSEWLRV